MNYLSLFSLSNLALLSDWFNETRELYVDVYLPPSGGGGIAYFIKSLVDLKDLVLSLNRSEIAFTIFRELQFPLRGLADEQFSEQVLQNMSNEETFEIVNLIYYLEHVNYCGSGKNHVDLRCQLTEVSGELIGIGQEPDVYSGKQSSNVDDIFEVHVLRKNHFQVFKNQDFYGPYLREPERYEWITTLWDE